MKLTPDDMDLVDRIIEACSRPGMYLVLHPGNQVHVDLLYGLIMGYTMARPCERYERFREWVCERRPEFRRSSLWFGGMVARELCYDHMQAVAQIGDWAREFDSLNPHRRA